MYNNFDKRSAPLIVDATYQNQHLKLRGSKMERLKIPEEA